MARRESLLRASNRGAALEPALAGRVRHDVREVHEKLHYDFYYIKNFSPWLDALILLRTVRTMLTGFGAK